MPEQHNPPDWKALEAHPVAALFPPATPDEYETLKQDVLERGPQEPILLYEGKILDGKSRHRACKALDIEPKFVTWEGDQTTLAAWLQAKGANLVRRHLSAEQRAAILLRSADVLPDVQQAIQGIVGAAEMRKQLGMKVPKQGDASGEAATIIGRIVGVSGSTVKRVRLVQEKHPDRMQDLAEGRTTCNKVLKEVEDANPAKPVAGAEPVKRYKLIYADLADKHLGTKPVSGWGEYKSAIALWTTPARLSEAFRLLLKWGWDYQTMFVWDRGKDSELLLLASRNHPPLALNDKVVLKDKAANQGGKSELFREIVLHTYPNTDGSRLDLFTQPVPEGWDQEPAKAK